MGVYWLPWPPPIRIWHLELTQDHLDTEGVQRSHCHFWWNPYNMGVTPTSCQFIHPHIMVPILQSPGLPERAGEARRADSASLCISIVQLTATNFRDWFWDQAWNNKAARPRQVLGTRVLIFQIRVCLFTLHLQYISYDWCAILRLTIIKM